ncbi:MAG: hypothetical protein R3F54_02605 [Alphaproteobacteria bacterium]
MQHQIGDRADAGAAPDVVSEIGIDVFIRLHRHQLQAKAESAGDGFGDVDIDADEFALLDEGERPIILVDRDLDRSLVVIAVAAGIFQVPSPSNDESPAVSAA